MSNKDKTNSEVLKEWEKEINLDGVAEIKDYDRRVVTARLLENTMDAQARGLFEKVDNNPFADLQEASTAPTPTNTTAAAKNYDPVLISMIRRAAPKLLAHDLVGVQPMKGPTGQIFALRSRYTSPTGDEAFFNEANTGFSSVRGGTNALGDATMNVGTDPTKTTPADFNFATGMTTAQAESLGAENNPAWAEMGISIEQITATCVSRKLKATYTHEFAQDLKAIHGLDAAKELAHVLSTELIAEMNREVIRSIQSTAVVGAPASRVTTAGIIDLDTDTNGRWSAERFVGLRLQLEFEANDIAKATRRGKGNILIVSSNVASALEAAKIIDSRDAGTLQIDDTGNLYAGRIGFIKVFVDPYATVDYAVLGYKGSNSWDAGLYYCPYTPLQLVNAMEPNTMTPVMGFATRYAMVANPFSKGLAPSNGTLEMNSNVYYRKMLIKNLM